MARQQTAVEYGPDDEDYLTPDERAAIRAMFKPALVRRYELPEERPWTRAEFFWAALGAALLGLAAGWTLRKYREQKKPAKTPTAAGSVRGLDLLGARRGS